MLDELFARFPSEMSAREKAQEKAKFRIRVALPYRRTCRHEMFDLVRDFGMPHVKTLFEGGQLTGDLLFVFPERWMSTVEQYVFLEILRVQPGITSVDIVTNSALIIGSLLKEQIMILKFEDDIDDPFTHVIDQYKKRLAGLKEKNGRKKKAS